MTYTTYIANNLKSHICRSIDARLTSQRTSNRAFVGISALFFATSAALTIVWCGSMLETGEMRMAGGWTMSMVWMRMPGERWTVFGMGIFPLGVALAEFEMQRPALARAVPIAVGVVVLIAGVLQFTEWKTRHLASCREEPGRRTLPADVSTAWRHGIRLGLHCAYCCSNLMAILLVIGIMDIAAMVVVTTAITIERLAPAGEFVPRAIAVVAVASGLLLIARAIGLG